MRKFPAASLLVLLSAASSLAQYPTLADPSAAALQSATTPPSVAGPEFLPTPVYPAQTYPAQTPASSLPADNSSLPTAPSNPTSEFWPTTIITDTPYRNRAWRAELGIIPNATLHLAGSVFDGWPETVSGARFFAGYESANGLGVRFRFLGIGNESTLDSEHVEIALGASSIDFYKRLFLETTEVVLGAGIAGSDVTLKQGPLHSSFLGGGGTVFTELWHPMLRWTHVDLGLVGRGRLAMTSGNWQRSPGTILVGGTTNDTLMISELAWGLEFRRRFGALQDKYFYFALLSDYQNFSSAWLTAWTATSASFSGLNLTTGIAY
jgi:hypothetical protein